MHSESRRERREQKLFNAAENGNFKIKVTLFKGEATKLTEDGFCVTRHGDDKKRAVPSTVSFKNAFDSDSEIPSDAKDYISGKTETFPDLSNWAQDLYVVAARANHEKSLRSIN